MPYASAEKRREYRKRYYAGDREGAIAKTREWRRANPEKRKGTAERNRLAYRPRAREAERRWRERNPGKIADYRKRNAQQIRAYAKRYAVKNRERIRQRRRRWYLERGKEQRRANPSISKASARRYYKRHRESILAKARTKRLEKIYGITAEIYNAMLHAQGGRCAICRCPPAPVGPGSLLHVDHCHTSGKVRGLLCIRCNTSIGGLNDDSAVLLAAANYIRAANTK